MLIDVLGSKDDRDYGTYGYNDGTLMYNDLRRTEESRRQLILKAAKVLHAYPDRTSKYLKGLEAGMKQAGATEATARRIRYEAAAIVASYGMGIEVPIQHREAECAGKTTAVTQRLDFRDLEAQDSWLALVNTARRMRQAADRRKRMQEGLAQRLGRGNHTVRKFPDMKFDKLREQLIERTATNQALDLLDAGIIAVAKAYLDLAADEIEILRAIEQRIHEKVKARNPQLGMSQLDARSRLLMVRSGIDYVERAEA